MGYVSYQEDILDARDKPNSFKYFPKLLRNSSPPQTSPVPKTRYVTSSEIQRRIQREIFRQQKEESMRWN